MTTQMPAPSRSPVISIIWGSRFYRAAVLSLFVSGIGISASTPQVSLYFVTELNASLPVVGLYYLTNIAAPIAGYLVGRASDHRADRLTLFRLCALVGAVGWLAMALSTHVWMPFLISIVALSVSGAAGAQIFAAVRDELSRHPTGARNRIVSTIRMAYTGGWIVGPVLGSWLGSLVGLRTLLLICAAIALLQILPLLRQHVPRQPAPPDALVGTNSGRTGTARRRLREMAPLLIFTALCVCALCGDTLKIAFLPVYMETVLNAPDAVRGAVIATQPLFELILIPVAGWAADRFGARRIVIVGAMLGVAANTGYGLSDGAGGLFVSQILMAGLWATIAGLGVTVAQDLYPQGIGVASSMFYSGLMLATALGGLIGSLGVAAIGMPDVFFLPAIVCAAATVGMTIQAVRQHRQGEKSQSRGRRSAAWSRRAPVGGKGQDAGEGGHELPQNDADAPGDEGRGR